MEGFTCETQVEFCTVPFVYQTKLETGGTPMVTGDNKKWFALGLILAVQFMVILDVAIVNVALPSIQVDLGFSQENLQWVISAYALVFGGFLLLGGRSAASLRSLELCMPDGRPPDGRTDSKGLTTW